MSLGPGFEIRNCTPWKVEAFLALAGSYTIDSVDLEPGELWQPDTGSWWMDIDAVLWGRGLPGSRQQLARATVTNCYAGPPWPFREERPRYSIIGGSGVPFDIVPSFWRQLPGSLENLAMMRGGMIRGVNANGEIYAWNGQQWTRLPGRAASVSVGVDGTTWMLDPDGRVAFWTGSGWRAPVLPPRTEGFRHIAVRRNSEAWGLTRDGQIFRGDGDIWYRIPGELQDVAVAYDGGVWGINRFGLIFQWRDAREWVPIDGRLTRISIGRDDLVWGVDANGDVFHRMGNGWRHVPTPERFKQVSVAADGSVGAVSRAGNVYVLG